MDEIEAVRRMEAAERRAAAAELRARLAADFDSDWAEVQAAKHAPSVRLLENGEADPVSLAAAAATITGLPSAKKFKRERKLTDGPPFYQDLRARLESPPADGAVTQADVDAMQARARAGAPQGGGGIKEAQRRLRGQPRGEQ